MLNEALTSGGLELLVVFSLALFLIAGCAGKDNWDSYRVYAEEKGWTREKYEKQVLGERIKKPERTAREDLYEKEKKKLVLELIKAPPVPLKIPDKVLRILVLPWVDEKGDLHAQQYIFVVVEDGEWMIGSSAKENEVRVLTPLRKQEAQ